jgi:hypothetical protein
MDSDGVLELRALTTYSDRSRRRYIFDLMNMVYPVQLLSLNALEAGMPLHGEYSQI